MNHKIHFRICTVCLFVLFLFDSGCTPSPRLDLDKGEHIAIVGNSLADRMQHDGWLESYIQIMHPDHQFTIRNLGFTGDQIHHRPRAHADFGDSDHHLRQVKAGVIFAFFGYNESFDNRPEEFRAHLTAWIEHTRRHAYNAVRSPRIVLFSPIAHENLNNPNLPDGSENNERLGLYSTVMAEVAAEMNLTFVDLFTTSQKLYNESDKPLTLNGVHLTDHGNQLIAEVITEELFGKPSRKMMNRLSDVRSAVLDKNYHWFNRYRATSGNDVWGSRAELHGNRETLQHELIMLDVMTANRDRVVWDAARGVKSEPDDRNVPPAQPVITNFSYEPDYLDGEEAIGLMTPEEGLSVNLFASETMFPELVNPVQMQVDSRGRIWVAAWATYPKWEPMKEMNDKLLILEDTTGNGVADKMTVFAEIHNPTGFEFWNNGVIVVSAPDILFLEDTTGDDRADKVTRLMGAIDSADTHHTANNVVLGPDGWIYYQRGVFHLNNVETPWQKPMESEISGLYRFNPRTFEFEFVVENIYNPHGISFDRWGNLFITDGTMGTAHQVYLDGHHFEKRPLLEHTVRPVPGNQVLSSSHFPDEYRDNFLIYNVIGFLGIKRYRLENQEGIVWGTEAGDLIYSDDPNFRPTHGVIGNDGALYISDWHNAIIGHMQHNLRDPMRDKIHGRIYRITADDRPLMDPVSIYGEPVDQLLDLLLHPDNGIRHRTRVELSGRSRDEVGSALMDWIARFDPESDEDAHALTEALWVFQQHNIQNRELLSLLLNSPDPNARQAARTAEWFWFERNPALAAEHLRHITRAPAADSFDRTGIELDLREEPVAQITINAVIEQMRFDVIRFDVNRGQPVQLTVDNPDFMPHNLVLTETGMADEVYQMAIEMGGGGFALGFVPDSPHILFASRLLRHEESQLIEFTAPDEPGEYPYVCTFPGHGELMRGVMVVH